jgi:Ser/Thr protein kinase RdoA (MazF antagonist)
MFKIFNPYYTEKTINSINVIDFLRKRNFRAVEIIPTSKGELYINVPMPEGVRIGMLCEFIEGRDAKIDDIEEIGKVAARLHNELGAYGGVLPKTFEKRFVIEEFPVMLRRMRYDEAKIKEIERIGDVVWERIKDFPVGVVHGDLFPINIKINGDEIILYDFDDARHMPLIYDVAYACFHMGIEKITKEKIEQQEKTIGLFMKGYNSVNPFAEFKVADIFNWFAYMQIETKLLGMRFSVPKHGINTATPILDRFYRWIGEWEEMFG